MRSKLHILWLLIFVVVVVSFRTRKQEIKPNIIIILVDDAGYADFGFMGSKDLQTPNLDNLAAHAFQFKDAHVTASVCSPSRAGLLTGRYQQRFGYECNEGEGYTGIDTSEVLLCEVLKQMGYATAAFGKWHLGYKENQNPINKGFDYYYGFLSGGRSYFYKPETDDKQGSKNALYENRKQVKFDGYLTDALSNKAVQFINNNGSKPFFMYWAPNAVHTPMEATKEDLEKFKNHPRQKLAAMTFALDRAVGNIVDALIKKDVFNNTLIFFLSDNGGAKSNKANNLPLKGFKGNKYEGGHRVPFFVSYPKLIKSKVEFNGLSSSLDIFPTALQAAGLTNFKTKYLDGVSLIPYLNGSKKTNPHNLLVWRKDKAAAIRYGMHKLIMIQGAGECLYNLQTDPFENIDLQKTSPQLVSQLKKEYKKWEKDKLKPNWTEGATWDTITFMIHQDLMQNKPIRVFNPEDLKIYLQKN
jgi:arylsulfatase A-like enzyme